MLEKFVSQAKGISGPLLIHFYLFLYFGGLSTGHPESEKHKDPRNQDPEEGFRSEKGLEKISLNPLFFSI